MSLGGVVALGERVGVELGSGVRVRVLVGVRKGVPRVEVGLGVADGNRVPVGVRVAGTMVEVSVGLGVAVGWSGVFNAINIAPAQ